MMPEIILGPPGTGKTTTLLGIVDYELENGVPPDRIAYLSFTRRAAEEARGRACQNFSLEPRQLPWFRTIHSLCFAALGLSSAEVLEGAKMTEFGEWLGIKMSGRVSMEEGGSFGFEAGDRCLFMDNLARVRGVSLEEQFAQDTDGLRWELVRKVSDGLAEYKRTRALHDFTDMLVMFARSEWRAQIDTLLVDEAQDLSQLQWRVVERIARGARRVIVAGDDDQAIYRWAGAAVEHFVGLPGEVRVLTQSYRVPLGVQAVASSALERIRDRREKRWLAKPGEEGVVRRVSSLDEVDFSAGQDVLVLARNAMFLKEDTMPMLRSEGVLYDFRGGGPVRPSVVEAVLDWEKLRAGRTISVAQAEKVYDQMSAGVGYARGHKKLPSFPDRDLEVGLPALREKGGLLTDLIWHDALTRVAAEERAYMVKALKRGEKITRRPTVRLSTIHGSKGGEADTVVLYRDMAPRTYNEMAKWPADEARAFYVAVTRAMRELIIIAPQGRRYYDI